MCCVVLCCVVLCCVVLCCVVCVCVCARALAIGQQMANHAVISSTWRAIDERHQRVECVCQSPGVAWWWVVGTCGCCVVVGHATNRARQRRAYLNRATFDVQWNESFANVSGWCRPRRMQKMKREPGEGVGGWVGHRPRLPLPRRQLSLDTRAKSQVGQPPLDAPSPLRQSAAHLSPHAHAVVERRKDVRNDRRGKTSQHAAADGNGGGRLFNV